jgi:hypothetical protein
VDCFFNLRNEGKPDTIEVGFPRGWEGDLIGFLAKNAHVRGIYSVETMAENPSYDENNGLTPPWWKVFKVPFESTGQTVVVENQYNTFLGPLGSSPFLDDLAFTYILKTGAFWKGNIEDARLTVSLKNVPFDQITNISPKGYTIEGNKISWRFQNFKPDRNIEISIMQDILYERLSMARKILEKEPGNAYAHFMLGTVYFHRDFLTDYSRKNDKAEREFQKAISLDPNLSDARWFLAFIYVNRNVEYPPKNLKTKALRDAREQFEYILQRDPEYRCTDKTFYQDPEIHGDNPKEVLKILTDNR